jgi:hypothetical protein
VSTLIKMEAPAYWSRWQVPGYGTVEKRGMSSLWYALDLNGRIVTTRCRTRVEAIEALTANSSRTIQQRVDGAVEELQRWVEYGDDDNADGTSRVLAENAQAILDLLVDDAPRERGDLHISAKQLTWAHLGHDITVTIGTEREGLHLTHFGFAADPTFPAGYRIVVTGPDFGDRFTLTPETSVEVHNWDGAHSNA